MNNSGEDIKKDAIKSEPIWYNDFADKLISENFLLTALEFHAELTESGREISKLKDFFSNPANFENQVTNKPDVAANLARSSSQVTLDSLDLTRFSEDGERSNEDKVAVLEFELRKAKETITALRNNLTFVAESETNKDRSPEESVKEDKAFPHSQSITIKPHEQRALNFLINEYLLLHGYKLTSITFADENESQDFEDWNDVGLNIARPWDLLTLYREGLKGCGYSSCVETKDFGCQVILYDEIQHNLQISELEAEIAELTSKIASMGLEFSKKLHSLENQRLIELESRTSITPDPECFEIIETMKSREESETKSDKSNGDWTKIGDKFKKESIDLKSDNQSNYESISVDDKTENQSSLFDNVTEVSQDSKKHEEFQDAENESNSEPLKVADNFNETISDAIDNDFDGENDSKVKSEEETPELQENTTLLNLINPVREIPDGFKKEILKHCDMNILSNSNEILTNWFYETPLSEISRNQLIEILSNSLPKIIPNIILNKREEITPLLVLSVCLNPDPSTRDKLLNLLFNLKKKPQPEERQVILRALLLIAQLMGSNTVENEVLPQCWEQITHKYIERRILVAESCFALAPYVSETIRNSLIVSIAQQLLQDREESVRKAAVNIVALLIALISDEDKYSQILDICLQMLNDESLEVLKALKYLLYPALAQWSFSLKRIQSDLFHKLLSKLKKDKSECVINVIEILLPYLIMTVADSKYLSQFTSKNHPSPTKRQEFCNLCKDLCDPSLFYEGNVGTVMKTFDFCTSVADFDTSKWPEMDWILEEFIPDLLVTGDLVLEDAIVLTRLISTLRHLCLGLGKNVTNQKIKPYLLNKLQECENGLVAGEDCQYSVIPLYLVGVLSTDLEALQEMSNTLHRFICALPLCGVSLTPLQIAIETLSQFQTWQILVLDAIWEGVVHQRPLVRSASATLFQSVIPYIPESLLSTKVTPALVTLSSDPEISVRTCSIPALGMLTNAKEKAIKDKVYMTLQSLLQDASSFNNHAIVAQLVKTVKIIYENCDRRFKEEVIIPQLATIAALGLEFKSNDLVQVLTETFATISFSHSQLSNECISTALLPGLRYLETSCNQLNLPYAEHIDSMIKEVERRLTTSRDSAGTSTLTSPTSEAKRLKPNAIATNVVVEDVKNRVTKIFNARPNTLQNVSGIFKKKT